MASKLPPYSTYRTDKTQMLVPQAMSKNNILTFTPRGFNQAVNVKFPDGRLAVCKKCKKNFKTKESCRVRSGHTGVPWTTAYICVTLDQSCIDQNGDLHKDKPLTVRMSNWQPVCLKKDFSSKTPVCASCKRTNRTKSFCRERHKHRQLPWSTVYVILSAADSTDPTTVVAAPSQLTSSEKEEVMNFPYNARKIDESGNQDDDQNLEGDSHVTDDIYKIDPSRTFLAQVSCTQNTIHWLEYMEGEEAPMTSESDVKALNDAIRSPSMRPDLHHATTYSMMSPQQQQQQHYFQHHQQQLAEWQAQYGHQILMPPPMIPFPPMVPPPHPSQMNETESKEFDPAAVPPPSPVAYAPWHAHVMFHQQMYHQNYLNHQLSLAQHSTPQPSSKRTSPEEGNEVEANSQQTPQKGIVDEPYTAQDDNNSQPEEFNEPRKAKRQKLENTDEDQSIVEPPPLETSKIEPSPIEAAIGITSLAPTSDGIDNTSPIDHDVFQGA